MVKTIVIWVESFLDVACEKLFKSANDSRSYSKNNGPRCRNVSDHCRNRINWAIIKYRVEEIISPCNCQFIGISVIFMMWYSAEIRFILVSVKKAEWYTRTWSSNHFYARKQLLLLAHLNQCNSVCLSVCPSVTRVDQSKTVQATITKSSPSGAWKTLVAGTVKIFHKFEGGHPERGR